MNPFFHYAKGKKKLGVMKKGARKTFFAYFVPLLFCLLRKFAKGKPPTFFITPCEAGQKGGKAKK
jgi:hypothetical protein